MYPSCCMCGKEIFEGDLREMCKQVVGFEKPRKKGLNALRMKRETGAVAHGSCVDAGVSKQKAGTSVHQGGLF